MRALKPILSILILTLLMYGCKKTEYKEMKPQLKIIVKDIDAQLINDANVNLFLTITDFQRGINSVSSGTTNKEGSILFTELDTVNYYFSVERGEKSNRFGVAAISNPLEMGYTVVIETIIE